MRTGAMGKKKLFFDVLDEKRLQILPKLTFLREDYGFYLAGGTALALQIRHRKSIDFDFYTPDDFDPKELFGKLKRNFKRIKPEHMAEGTLIAAIDDVEMSFFRYEYPLLKPLVRTGYIDLLSAEDIAAMKIIAIVQRGTRRDFVDIFYLLKTMRLNKLLTLTQKKYEAFNKYQGLRALTYFEDAEEDNSRRRLEVFEKMEWGKIKQEIIEIISTYTREHLPKK